MNKLFAIFLVFLFCGCNNFDTPIIITNNLCEIYGSQSRLATENDYQILKIQHGFQIIFNPEIQSISILSFSINSEMLQIYEGYIVRNNGRESLVEYLDDRIQYQTNALYEFQYNTTGKITNYQHRITFLEINQNDFPAELEILFCITQ